MAKQDPLSSTLATVDHVLRQRFPDDFDKRCMYAAFGLRALLRRTGIGSEIVGGRYTCFVVSADLQHASHQGFGTGSNDQASHYWVEAQGYLLDPGPHYLPLRSSFPAAPIPMVRWPLASPIPHFMRYQEQARYHQEAKLRSSQEIQDRMNQFLAACEEARTDVATPCWQLKGMESLRYAAGNRDRWALGALRFIAEYPPSSLPF
jgi:hypothetical protein